MKQSLNTNEASTEIGEATARSKEEEEEEKAPVDCILSVGGRKREGGWRRRPVGIRGGEAGVGFFFGRRERTKKMMIFDF